MEKERILSELKTKIGDPSIANKFSNITERTLTEYVDKLYPSLGDNPLIDDNFYSTHIGILETVAGNIRFAASSAVEDYKQKNPVKEQRVEQPNPTPTQTPSQSDDTATVLKALAEKLERIEQDKVNAEKQAQLEKRVSEAKAELKSKGADNEAVLEIALGLTRLSGDESKEDIASKVKAEYDKQYTKLYGDGYVSGGSRMNVSHTGNFAAYKAQKQKEGKLPK